MKKHTKIIIVLILLIATAVSAFGGPGYTIAGYYPNWMRWSTPADQLNYDGLTHILRAFIWPNADGSIATYSGFSYPELVTLAHEHKVKIMVAVGGYGQSDGFAPVVADSAKRTNFIENLLNYCLDNDYDGIDIDWEYPKNNTERSNLNTLVREMRAAFDEIDPDLIISMAVPAGSWSGSRFDFNTLKNYLNWIGCMTYDFHGSWSTIGHNAPLFAPSGDPIGSADLSIKYLLSAGVPSNKILFGLPFYGWNFKGNTPGSSHDGANQVQYRNIVPDLDSQWIYNWDKLANVPYLTNNDNNRWLSFDDTISIRLKCDYTKEKELAGVMMWALGQDDLGDEQPLMATIARSLEVTSLNEDAVARNRLIHTDYHLGQNYPNPFNGSTTLRFYVAEPQVVMLSVYNSNGQNIGPETLYAAGRGWNRAIFKADHLPSGLYLYRIKTAGEMLTGKMLLVR